jgi:hypothetical protein
MAKYPGFIGPSGRVRSINVNAERTINWYLENVGGTPKATPWLAPTPGLAPFVVLADGPVRALFSMDGRAFTVVGTGFYEIFANHTATLRGLVNANAFPATISSNGTNGNQLLVTSAGNDFLFDLALNTFILLPDDGIGGPTRPTRMATFSDGYFIALRANSNEFQISALYDGTDWDALDVFQVSTVADQVVALVESHRDLWLFGSQTTSVWSNTGDADVPYQPVPGVKIEQGCGAAFTAVPFDNAIMWLGSGVSGDRIVWRANGYTPERVSTHAVEFALGQAHRIDDAIAWTYQQEGHTFYVLYVPDLETVRGFATTWVYDAATREWHERAMWDAIKLDWQPHLGRCHTYAFGAHLVGDRTSGAIYDLQLGLAGDTVVVTGVTPGVPIPDPEPEPAEYFLLASAGSYATTGSAAESAQSDYAFATSAGSYAVTGSAAVNDVDPLLLTPEDFTYLGMFAAPPDTGAGDSWGFFYQRGSITGRYVDGELRLLMTGTGDAPSNGYNGYQLYELTIPSEGSWTTNPNTAPYATLIKNWGAMSAGIRPIVDTNGSVMAGILWDESRNAVWYAYGARYNVSGWNDPSIGMAVLDDDAGTLTKYGHWRTRTGSKRTGGYMMAIPQAIADAHFGGRTLGLGASTTSGNATAPWGPVLQPAAFVADYLTRPADALETVPGESAPNGPTGAQPRWSIDTLDTLFHSISNKKARYTDADDYRYCGWGSTPGTNDPGIPPYDCANGSWVIEVPNVWYLDACFAGVWIDVGTKYGVCFFARINVPSDTYPVVHQWYGPGPCCHGQSDVRKADSTPGDQSSSMRNHLLIYDPQEFIDSANGDIQPWELQETYVADMAETYFAGSAEWEDDAYKIDGSWFDATTNRLYVVKGDRDGRNGGSPGRPMIYVFEVAV